MCTHTSDNWHLLQPQGNILNKSSNAEVSVTDHSADSDHFVNLDSGCLLKTCFVQLVGFKVEASMKPTLCFRMPTGVIFNLETQGYGWQAVWDWLYKASSVIIGLPYIVAFHNSHSF